MVLVDTCPYIESGYAGNIAAAELLDGIGFQRLLDGMIQRRDI